MYGYDEFKLFGEIEFPLYEAKVISDLKNYIDSQTENYILNVNEIEFINHVIDKYKINHIEFLFDEIFIDNTEEMVAAEYWPWEYNVYKGKKYPVDVIMYHIPFGGNEELLRCIPNTRFLSSQKISINSGALCFKVYSFDKNPEKIKKEFESFIGYLQSMHKNLEEDINQSNNRILNTAEGYFKTVKERILKRKNMLSALGVPIKKKEDAPKTLQFQCLKIIFQLSL